MDSKRIGIISDTHGDIAGAVKGMKALGNLDCILHLGDYVEDGLRIEQHLGIEVIGVRGNCDCSSTLPEDRLLTIGGKRIFMTHGHGYDVKWTYHKLFYKGLEVEADVVLFGHTHVATRFIEEGILVMNPGSTSHPRGSHEKTYAVVEIGQNITGQIVTIS